MTALTRLVITVPACVYDIVCTAVVHGSTPSYVPALQLPDVGTEPEVKPGSPGKQSSPSPATGGHNVPKKTQQ